MDEAPTRPTVRGRKTEAALQHAARRVIARKGFLNTTVADITSEAGRSTASFYNYFDSKEDLLASWAGTFQREALERASVHYRHGATPRELVDASVRAHWNTYKEHVAEMVGVFQYSMINDEFAERWRDLCAEAIDSIARGVRRAQAEGYCPTAHPELVGSAIVAMLNQFAYVWLAQGGEAVEMDFDEEEAIATLADVWYHSIYWVASEETESGGTTGRRATRQGTVASAAPRRKVSG
jgi:AcrR family transcriptional regulator